MIVKQLRSALFRSALTHSGVNTEAQILEWIKRRSMANTHSVVLKPLDELKGWHFKPSSGDLEHATGKFFAVRGLKIRIDAGGLRSWEQPILHQPEVGILGFIACRIDDVLHVLVQAKMEPGNVNLTQISPTVQATRSNYTQVHGGRRPPFVDQFLNKAGYVHLDQLQSEQGTRYFRKRNRNMILEVENLGANSAPEDYLWVTVGQLNRLMGHPNLMHLDCRSILGSISFGMGMGDTIYQSENYSGFEAEVARSASIPYDHVGADCRFVYSWLAELKSNVVSDIEIVPLNMLTEWGFSDGAIRHRSGAFFSIVGVDVQSTNREVSGWSQPLLRSIDGGIIGLIVQMQNGYLRVLVQALVEPGVIDLLELAPTVQFTPSNYQVALKVPLPHFAEIFLEPKISDIRFDSTLSDEGGRFYHSQQRHMIVEIAEDVRLDPPKEYRWLTLTQIQRALENSSIANMELRSILSCFSFGECAD